MTQINADRKEEEDLATENTEDTEKRIGFPLCGLCALCGYSLSFNCVHPRASASFAFKKEPCCGKKLLKTPAAAVSQGGNVR